MTRTLEPTTTAAATVVDSAPARDLLAAAPTRSAGVGVGVGVGAAVARRCRTVVACAFEYLDGELGPALAAMVAEHLAACPGCRRRVDRDRALLDAVARSGRGVAAVVVASPALRTRVRRALARAEVARSSARRRA